jgi:hypothetical protein
MACDTKSHQLSGRKTSVSVHGRFPTSACIPGNGHVRSQG